MTSSSLTTTLASYATLASPAFTGTATLGGVSIATTGILTNPTITGPSMVNLTSATLPSTTAQVGFNTSFKGTPNFTFTSANTIKNVASITFPSIGVWMLLATGVFTVSQASQSSFMGDLTFGLCVSSTAYDTNWAPNTRTVFFNTGGQLIYATYTHECSKMVSVTQTTSATLYLNASVAVTTPAAPVFASYYYSDTRIA